MYLYKDEEGLYHIDDKIMPAKSILLRVDRTKTIIYFVTVEGDVLTSSIEITNTLKEDGTPYTDLEEVLVVLKDFLA